MKNKIGARLGDPNYMMESRVYADKSRHKQEMTPEVENGE